MFTLAVKIPRPERFVDVAKHARGGNGQAAATLLLPEKHKQSPKDTREQCHVPLHATKKAQGPFACLDVLHNAILLASTQKSLDAF